MQGAFTVVLKNFVKVLEKKFGTMPKSNLSHKGEDHTGIYLGP